MTGSERPSPEPLLKKETSPAVLGGENSGNALEPSNALNFGVWGISAVLSRGIPGEALRAFPEEIPEFFRNFFRKVPAVLRVWPRHKHPRESFKVIFYLAGYFSFARSFSGGNSGIFSRISSGKSQPYWGCGLVISQGLACAWSIAGDCADSGFSTLSSLENQLRC